MHYIQPGIFTKGEGEKYVTYLQNQVLQPFQTFILTFHSIKTTVLEQSS